MLNMGGSKNFLLEISAVNEHATDGFGGKRRSAIKRQL